MAFLLLHIIINQQVKPRNNVSISPLMNGSMRVIEFVSTSTWLFQHQLGYV